MAGAPGACRGRGRSPGIAFLRRARQGNGLFNALCLFVFNLKAGALQRSALRRKINRDGRDSVPGESRSWVWADGSRLKGLFRLVRSGPRARSRYGE